MSVSSCYFFFFFNDTATTEIYTLSLHDALPIYRVHRGNGQILSEPSGQPGDAVLAVRDRKSTRLNSSHSQISYAVFCLKKKKELRLQLFDEQRRLSLMFDYLFGRGVSGALPHSG